jgi:hypothetical protein
MEAPLRDALLDRARRHGWCADQWATVVPVLHDVDLDGRPAVSTTVPATGPTEHRGDFDPLADVLAGLAVAPGAADLLASVDAVTDAAIARFRAWVAEARPVADGPYLAVLERVLRELRPEPPG